MRWCHRRYVLPFAVLSQFVGSFAAPVANACCLTDWLYGKQPAYVAGYTPVVGAPVTTITPMPGPAMGAPAIAPPPGYAANYPGYTAGYTPLMTAAPNSSLLPLNPTSIYTPSQAYSLQRPAYGAVPLDNPSVYTGLPTVNSPVVSGYRGAVSTGSTFMGAGNVYPNSSYATNPAGVQPVTAYRPATGYSAATGYPTPIRSGLSRFFNSLLGTGYRSSYYTAPITYYRPATTLDPVTGTTVTVQRACDSTVQQLQRTPYTTFQGLASQPTMVAPTTMDPCMTTVDSCGIATSVAPVTSPYGASPYAASPSTQLAPAGSYAAQPSWGGAPSASAIPSTIDPNGYGGVAQTGDLQPMAPPASAPSNLQPFDAQRQTLSPLTGSPYASEPPAESQSSPSDQPPASQYRYSIEPPAQSNSPAKEPAEAERTDSSDVYDSYRYQSELEDQGESEEGPQNSLDDYLSRSRQEVQRDREDLRRLTAGNLSANPSAAPRVRPIPAPEGYRHAFDDGSAQAAAPVARPSTSPVRSIPSLTPPSGSGVGPLQAPDLLPALPPPPRTSGGAYEQAQSRMVPSMEDEGPVQWGYKVREASLTERRPSLPETAALSEPAGDYQPVRQPVQERLNRVQSRRPAVAPVNATPRASQPAKPQATQHQESGWHALNR
ncbi:hypothetical protein [Rhodopirellula sp. P2]|uniref:hypothetical protein n=1 Tax=Rhodopirellula sp. P2 TaxID=2127060 RepID=UPI002367581A|nr:hypothetical protein [Rhodopirellula sp. P2]WDQ18057.1 hypothetical protein PSR62_05755 [Rhodopirellula sp. P2]